MMLVHRFESRIIRIRIPYWNIKADYLFILIIIKYKINNINNTMKSTKWSNLLNMVNCYINISFIRTTTIHYLKVYLNINIYIVQIL
jgi:hypothetical protein